MINNHEYYVGNDAPSSRQIARLAAACISFAKRHDALKIRQLPRAGEKRYLVVPIILTEMPELAEQDGDLYSQYYSAILTQREQHQRELTYIRGYKVRCLDDARSVRQVSRFKWRGTTVECATAEFHFSDTPHLRAHDFDLEANNFSLDTDAVDLLHATMQIESITSADMNELLREFERVAQKAESHVDSYTTQ